MKYMRNRFILLIVVCGPPVIYSCWNILSKEHSKTYSKYHSFMTQPYTMANDLYFIYDDDMMITR